MEYNKIAKAVHKNAVEHGWWEETRPVACVMALIHSELSEALEEERVGRPFVYVEDEYNGRETDMEHFNGRKPEGTGIELTDTVIRILDLAGRYRVDMDKIMGCKFLDLVPDIYSLIADCHFYVSEAYIKHCEGDDAEKIFSSLGEVVCMIEGYVAEAGYSLEQLINIKHEYNKTRPYKHGKAF